MAQEVTTAYNTRVLTLFYCLQISSIVFSYTSILSAFSSRSSPRMPRALPLLLLRLLLPLFLLHLLHRRASLSLYLPLPLPPLYSLSSFSPSFTVGLPLLSLPFDSPRLLRVAPLCSPSPPIPFRSFSLSSLLPPCPPSPAFLFFRAPVHTSALYTSRCTLFSIRFLARSRFRPACFCRARQIR